MVAKGLHTEAERQLAALVAMPTMTDDVVANEQALDYIEHYVASRGMYIQRFHFNGHGSLVASSRPNNAKHPAVLLAAHVDVAPADEALFTLARKGDQLTGRGVYDMKFAIASYMQLVDDLQGRLEDYDFAIMLTTDEEYGGHKGFNGSETLVKAGYRPKICILPDSAAPGWNIEQSVKAPWRFELIAKGKIAHGSRPWEGESASFKLIQALHELKQCFTHHGPLTDTLNIGIIHGGEAFNQIPAFMTAAIEIRITKQENYHKLLPKIQKICAAHDVLYEEKVVRNVLHHDLSQPLISSYIDSVQEVAGTRPKAIMSSGSSDARHFMGAGIPCIVSCPEGGGHHGENEWISRQSFLQFVPILHNYLNKTAKITTPRQVDTEPALV